MSVQCYCCTPEALLECTQLISKFLLVVLIHPLIDVQFHPWEHPQYRKKIQAGSVGFDYPLEYVQVLPLDPPPYWLKMQGDSVDLDHSLGQVLLVSVELVTVQILCQV